ncbi:MAG: threonine ammonia-lyase, biosynthetic, partial [Pseudomonadota bacterium]|nr:threonine ammonia-lyase, biosynthetic [Pseudomonadota bacterium]
DPDVIAGQGTIGMEILRQYQNRIDAIFVPVGGGGLIAGIASYVKRVSPLTRIIGVEPVDANAMKQSLAAGKRVRLDQVGLFADGVAVKMVGQETFRLCQDLVDEVIEVNTDEICAAIKDVFEDTRSILEPAGALAVAGLKNYVKRESWENTTLVAIASGANMNFDRLQHVAERAELGENRETILAVTIPETPGSFKSFCRQLGARSITEFNYRFSDRVKAHVFVGIQVTSREEVTEIIEKLKSVGLETCDFSDNEMAKLHIRHLVGGHAPDIQNELLYRFEFPERPGALMNFLDAMSHNWNISLFHYRNHGTDYGRVLVGMQVPPDDMKEFEGFLERLGYVSYNETGNPAYQLFLS